MNTIHQKKIKLITKKLGRITRRDKCLVLSENNKSKLYERHEHNKMIMNLCIKERDKIKAFYTDMRKKSETYINK